MVKLNRCISNLPNSPVTLVKVNRWAFVFFDHLIYTSN